MEKRHYISAAEIAELFHQPRPKKKHRVLSWQLARASLLVVVGIYFLINAPAISNQLSYWWENDIGRATQTKDNQLSFTSFTGDDTDDSDTPQGGSSPRADLGKNNGSSGNKSTATDKQAPPHVPGNTIVIPKIKVKAPLIWDASGGQSVNEDLTKALESGVVRYPQTALPNQIGNVFLAGHSSNYWWEKGKYKTVFALLNRLVVGDLIYINYNGTVYTYRVSGQKVVKPSDTWVLDPTPTPTLSLMTCTPTGTALRRRVVTADLIGPKDNLEKQVVTPRVDSLESIR